MVVSETACDLRHKSTWRSVSCTAVMWCRKLSGHLTTSNQDEPQRSACGLVVESCFSTRAFTLCPAAARRSSQRRSLSRENFGGGDYHVCLRAGIHGGGLLFSPRKEYVVPSSCTAAMWCRRMSTQPWPPSRRSAPSCWLCGPLGDEKRDTRPLGFHQWCALQCRPVCVMLVQDLRCTSRSGAFRMRSALVCLGRS